MNWLANSIGLLVLRLWFAGMMLVAHGLPKLTGFATLVKDFPDPLRIGSFTSLSLAIFAEFFCAVLVMLGLGTRLAVLPLIITMLVAATRVHADHAFNLKEPSLLYLAGFVAILILGGGTFSLDSTLWKWMRRRRAKHV